MTTEQSYSSALNTFFPLITSNQCSPSAPLEFYLCLRIHFFTLKFHSIAQQFFLTSASLGKILSYTFLFYFCKVFSCPGMGGESFFFLSIFIHSFQHLPTVYQQKTLVNNYSRLSVNYGKIHPKVVIELYLCPRIYTELGVHIDFEVKKKIPKLFPFALLPFLFHLPYAFRALKKGGHINSRDNPYFYNN